MKFIGPKTSIVAGLEIRLKNLLSSIWAAAGFWRVEREA
jgi:hypothetical protein